MRYLRTGLGAAVASLALLAPVASAKVTHTPNGHPVSIMARPGGSSAQSRGASSSSGALLVDHGGPVLAGETPYLIYWAPSGHPIAPASVSLMNQYLGDVSADSGHSTTNVYSVLGQYGSPYSQTFGSRSQAVTDTHPYPTKQGGCKLGAGMTACVTDASIQHEIASLITSGAVPSPGAPGTGSTPIFFMVTPVDVNVCISGGSCVSNAFCAYHDYFTAGGADVLYASVPFSVFASSTKGCQTDGNPIYETPVGSGGDEAYNVADDLSHELSETITDPLINAWYTTNGYEVGDLCEAYAATTDLSKGLSSLSYSPAFGDASTGYLYDQVINRNKYYNQTEYSNGAGQCLAGVTPLSG